MSESATPLTRTFVISLADCCDRRRRFAERAKDSALRWEFYDAHTSAGTGLVYEEEAAILHKGRPLTAGEIGCYSSHFALWSQLLDDDADQYLILEDDIVVDWPRIEAIARCDLAEQGIEYLRLYYKRPVPFLLVRDDFLFKSMRLVQLLGKADGTQGYFIRRSAAAKLVEAAARIVRPVDDQLDRFWEHGVLNHSVFPFPLFEEAGPSLIGLDRFAKAGATSRRRRPLATRARDRLAATKAVLQARLDHWLRQQRGGQVRSHGSGR